MDLFWKTGMKSLLSALALVSAGVFGVVSINAQAADGTVAIRGAVADTTCPTGCAGFATEALARFENRTTDEPTTGYLKNVSIGNGGKNAEIRLLNDQLQPIDIRINTNNDVA
jgi:major type 1 subunit fimbrin (pilin)